MATRRRPQQPRPAAQPAPRETPETASLSFAQTMTNTQDPEQAAAEAAQALHDNPPPTSIPVTEGASTAEARREVAQHGNPLNPLAVADDAFLAKLQGLVEYHENHSAQIQNVRATVPDAERMADAKAADLLRQAEVEKQRRARMNPEEFRASNLPPISSLVMHMHADPSAYRDLKGQRPCEKDEILEWVSVQNAETGRSDDEQWVIAKTHTGSRLVNDESGSPIYRHGCVLMKCKADQSAARKAFALDGKSQQAVSEIRRRDNDQMEASRRGGITTGAMKTVERGLRDPFEATRLRPGEMEIPIP